MTERGYGKRAASRLWHRRASPHSWGSSVEVVPADIMVPDPPASETGLWIERILPLPLGQQLKTLNTYHGLCRRVFYLYRVSRNAVTLGLACAGHHTVQ